MGKGEGHHKPSTIVKRQEKTKQIMNTLGVLLSMHWVLGRVGKGTGLDTGLFRGVERRNTNIIIICIY